MAKRLGERIPEIGWIVESPCLVGYTSSVIVFDPEKEINESKITK